MDRPRWSRPRAGLRRSPLSPWTALSAALLLLPLLALAACAPATEVDPAGRSAEGAAEAGAGQPTEILWDTWGVPHVFAASDEDLFHAQGWAHARAHGDLVLRLYGEARGRAAEYWGAEHLGSDRWVHTVGIPERAADWLAAQTPRERAFLDAFAEGFNAYAAAHPERIDDQVEPVLPVTARDLLAHTQRVIHFTFLVNPGEVAAARERWASLDRPPNPPSPFPPHGGQGAPPPGTSSPDRLATSRPGTATNGSRGGAAGGGASRVVIAGSNAWAIAPERSASGGALLLANPHLPWSHLFTWFELQLTAPGVDAYGATLVGSPFLGIGFNDHLGWTHTVNTLDGADLYELELAPLPSTGAGTGDDGEGNGNGYRWGDEVRPFEERTVTLRVRTAAGELQDEPLTVRSSVHGPVVAETSDSALALRVVGLDQPHLTSQYWQMATATDLEQFEAALRRLQMPMFTVLYADRDGHILHLFGGRVPDRPAGVEGWSGIVPGTGPETLWTGTLPYDRLPRVLDPESGWLQNANDPPWTTTFPRALDPEAFPEHVAPRFMSFRAQRSAGLAAADDSFTLDEFIDAKHSTRMELADRLLDDLAAAVEAQGDADAERAMAVLSAWDRSADADSRGAVLFERFVRALEGGGGGAFATPWSPDAPRTTPDGLADPAGAAAALSAAARRTEELHGSLDVPWGEVRRLRLGEHDLPANGGPGGLGIFRVVGFRPADTGDGGVAAGGDSFVAAVDFGARPPRARALLSYGNSTQPGSPHAGDQLELFAKKELRPVWRERAEIEPHLAEREVLERAPQDPGELEPAAE